MNWKKRKTRRRIAKHYGYDHYWEWKRNLKFCLYYTSFRENLEAGVYEFSEILPKMNQMYCKAGFPQYCMTQEEWYADVMKAYNESDFQKDEMIVQFINREFESPSMKVNRPVSIVVKHNFDVQLKPELKGQSEQPEGLK